jgi:hypothetical protein
MGHGTGPRDRHCVVFLLRRNGHESTVPSFTAVGRSWLAYELAAAIGRRTTWIRVAEANGQRILAACEEYHAANGRFPRKLDELVPNYINSVPVVKYCLGPGSRFFYGAPEHGNAILAWEIVSPHYRRTYNFGTRSWGYVD